MFGYIKPMIPELRVKEHELYKSIYCGLCRAMGEHICNTNRMTLSYDVVFLALVRCALTNEEIHVEKGRCFIHPIKARNHAFIPETLEYCAKISALLTFYNIEDNVNDAKGFSSLKYRLLLPSAKRFMKKADMPKLSEMMAELLSELSGLEKAGGSADRNADCFGRLLAEVFAYNIKDASASRRAYEIGYHCGKWIYIIDAADDFEKDRKKGEYNPFSSLDALPTEMIDISTTLELKAAYEAFTSADVKNEVIRSIIINILTLGMPEVTKKITGVSK